MSSGVPKRLIPELPPVSSSNRLTTDGIATAIAKVASARYSPESRSAGRPNASPTSPATSAANGSVQTSFMPPPIWPAELLVAGHEDRRRVPADRHERAVT